LERTTRTVPFAAFTACGGPTCGGEVGAAVETWAYPYGIVNDVMFEGELTLGYTVCPEVESW
jgi:hypothetical protein